MADKPKLAVDNEPVQKRRFKIAERRVAAKNPKYTYDDVKAEVERMEQEEEVGRSS